MAQLDVRQDKPYRRGLILGLTIAEIMILLIFVLLMALAAALASREEQIQVLDQGGASQLVSALQEAYPQAATSEDYFKELNRAIEMRRMIEEQGEEAAGSQLIEDARLGREAREAAENVGAEDPMAYIRSVPEQLREARRGEFPPFFSLSEARGYYFDSGRATLRPGFEKSLRSDVIPQLVQFISDYGVDVIEVIGHTDEVPMTGRSNLDQRLIAASQGNYPIAQLRSTDNSGLAMARAVSVVTVLRSDNRLANVTILPLSGAQMVVPVDRAADGSAAMSDQSRRRIEIRLRRSTEEAGANGARVLE
ncbi:hypothetical protein EH30_14445 [Erythrobacter sp. JL475]|nr:hypothetical protein EH30_14445 [Erythrobacter sp. JL475]